MRDLIFVSLEPWNAIWRRNQFLCAELATRFPEMRLLFVDRLLFAPAIWKGRQRVPNFSRRLRRIEEFPNVRAFAPLKTVPNPVPGGRAWNEFSMLQQITRAARVCGLRDPLLWLNPFDFGFLIGHLNERGVIYDITDDWELAAPEGPRRDAIRDLDRDLCRRADLTVVCSEALYESRRTVARRALLLPNGVDAAHYADLERFDTRPRGQFAEDGTFKKEVRSERLEVGTENLTSNLSLLTSWDAKRPVFGYTGSLHPERIDLDLVKALARAFPTGSVVLIGPNHFTGDALARELRDFPNVHAPGAVAYADIPRVMAGFDVCIVPHLRSGFVESLNPIKLWEFLAAGKPIVSADVAGFRNFPQLVRLASDTSAFVEACRDALGEVNACAGFSSASPCQSEARQHEARGHSWHSRADDLLRALAEADLIEDAAPAPRVEVPV